jgi:uroporphyrinogen-III synthase
MAAARILSTKKLAPNQKQYLLNAGLAVVEADFIKTCKKAFANETLNHIFIFTSQNAFLSFLENEESKKYTTHKIFCVGSKTKEIIEQAGFRVEAYADYAEHLAEIIINSYPEESYTFFSGNMRRDTLPDALAEAGVAFNEVEVYETVLHPQKINAVIDGILFFSPSGIDSYLKLNTIDSETCFCIGTTTATALKDITNNIVISNKPTIENVIVQVINYYKI